MAWQGQVTWLSAPLIRGGVSSKGPERRPRNTWCVWSLGSCVAPQEGHVGAQNLVRLKKGDGSLA